MKTKIDKMTRLAYRRTYDATPKGQAERLRYQLKKRYGISVAAYQQLLAQQNGVCAICREPGRTASRGNRLCVDHDHTTGRVRSLLCTGCNTAIGSLRESPLLARAAATYLEQQLAKELTGE